MKSLLKVILPPFVGFAIFFLVVRYSPLYFTLNIGEIGGGNLASFMAYFKFMLPLLFADAVLTQLLIVIPIWKNLKGSPAILKANTIVDVAFVCLLFALVLSYPISDMQNGSLHFVKLLGFMTMVQFAYWAMNLFILHLLE